MTDGDELLTDNQLNSEEVEQQRNWPHQEGVEKADQSEKERHLCDGPEAKHSLVYHLCVVEWWSVSG